MRCYRHFFLPHSSSSSRFTAGAFAFFILSQSSLAGNDAEAVVLDLMQPLAAGRQFRGFGWEARRDEPGRKGTLQHGEPNTVG